MKKFLKSLVPPIILEIYRKTKRNKYGWYGNYKTWVEAKNASTGYDSEKILEKVKSSLLKVKNGDAVFERDSVIFEEVQYSWPFIAGLMYAAAKCQGKLNVLDFGGSLGSSYYQNKKFLDGLNQVTWSIVEQKKFVDIGKQYFEDERLNFFYNVKDCIKKKKPKTLVLASILQYIENPYELLNDILVYDFDIIIIDRTYFNIQNRNVIKLQVVPPEIYEASYPCWFFDENYFIEYFKNKCYRVIEKFSWPVEAGSEYTLIGMIMKKDSI